MSKSRRRTICCGSVPLRVGATACRKRATVKRGGRWYCAQHDPDGEWMKKHGDRVRSHGDGR